MGDEGRGRVPARVRQDVLQTGVSQASGGRGTVLEPSRQGKSGRAADASSCADAICARRVNSCLFCENVFLFTCTVYLSLAMKFKTSLVAWSYYVTYAFSK